jgi:hypothetical protein
MRRVFPDSTLFERGLGAKVVHLRARSLDLIPDEEPAGPPAILLRGSDLDRLEVVDNMLVVHYVEDIQED